MTQRYHNLPALRGEGTHLSRCGGQLAIYRFVQGVNLVTTPSFELATALPLRVNRVVENGDTFTVAGSAVIYGALEVATGGTTEIAVGGTIEIRTDCEQTTAAAYDGLYGVEIAIQDGYTGVTDAPRNGVYVEVLLQPGDHVASAYVRGGTGTHRLTVRDATNVILASQTIAASNNWQRVVVFFAVSSLDDYRVFVEADDASTAPLLTDAWMVDTGSTVTPYGDGSFPGWEWDGTPDFSESTRVSGPSGELIELDNYGFFLTALTGHLVPTIEPTSVPYGQLAGSRYARNRVASRPLTIRGRVQGNTALHLRQNREGLWGLLNPIRAAVPDATRLRYLPDGDTAQAVEIDVVYISGLSGQTDNNYGEDIALQFVAPSPYWRDTTQESQVLSIGANTVTYDGTAFAPVRILASGTGSITSIANTTTGATLTLTATLADAAYEIDTEFLTATLGGSDARNTIDASSDFIAFGLEPGDNNITLTADAGVTVGLVWVARYQSAWKGEA